MRWLDSTRDARKACELKQSFIDWKRPPHATESMRANSKKPQRGADHDLFCKVRGHEALSDDLRGLFTVVEQVSALRADFSHPSHAWCSSNLALNAVLSARAVSWTFPHPRSLQCLVGYRDGDHNARA
jgi:hypothetical protein